MNEEIMKKLRSYGKDYLVVCNLKKEYIDNRSVGVYLHTCYKGKAGFSSLFFD